MVVFRTTKIEHDSSVALATAGGEAGPPAAAVAVLQVRLVGQVVVEQLLQQQDAEGQHGFLRFGRPGRRRLLAEPRDQPGDLGLDAVALVAVGREAPEAFARQQRFLATEVFAAGGLHGAEAGQQVPARRRRRQRFQQGVGVVDQTAVIRVDLVAAGLQDVLPGQPGPGQRVGIGDASMIGSACRVFARPLAPRGRRMAGRERRNGEPCLRHRPA